MGIPQPALQTSISYPMGMWMDSLKNIYYTENTDNRLSVLTKDSKYQTVINIAIVTNPTCVTGDNMGLLYVGNDADANILVLTPAVDVPSEVTKNGDL